MPKDSKGSTGSSYIVDRKNRKVLIPIDVNKIEDIKKVLGTLTEEVAHGKDALEGRQDKKVAEDKSNDEEGLESLGRPANEYVKKRFGEDNNSKIKLTTDGIDLSNADVGEKVGDVANENYEIATFSSAGVGLIGIGGLSLSSENNEYIKKVTIEVKEKLSKFGNNVKILYAVAKTLIEEKLKEKGIEADVKITEDKNGNVSYTVYPLDKGNKRNSKLSNSSGTNISKASSSNNSDKKNENKEENINKDDKGSEDNRDNKEPNNNEEKKQPPKNKDDSNIELKIGAGTGAAYEVKNSNNKNTTSTVQGSSNKNTNPSNQREQVSQSNKNNTNNLKVEVRNSTNQRVSKGSSDTTQRVVSTVSNNNKVGDLIFYAEEDGYEVYYRTMSLKNYESFKKTGKIPATGETTISPTQKFSEEGYNGVLVKFKVKKGTTDKLIDIGVRAESSTLAKEFSNMNKSTSGWGKNHARFKEEKGQLNIGLGKEKALNIFNENIVEADVINMNNKKEVNKK